VEKTHDLGLQYFGRKTS